MSAVRKSVEEAIIALSAKVISAVGPDGARPTGQKACSREGCPCAFTRDQLEDLR
jgi:hypothetical protein